MMIVYVIYCQLPLSPICDGLHTSAALGHPFFFQTDCWAVATLRIKPYCLFVRVAGSRPMRWLANIAQPLFSHAWTVSHLSIAWGARVRIKKAVKSTPSESRLYVLVGRGRSNGS